MGLKTYIFKFQVFAACSHHVGEVTSLGEHPVRNRNEKVSQGLYEVTIPLFGYSTGGKPWGNINDDAGLVLS